jgi:hypothetical protein
VVKYRYIFVMYCTNQARASTVALPRSASLLLAGLLLRP